MTRSLLLVLSVLAALVVALVVLITRAPAVDATARQIESRTPESSEEHAERYERIERSLADLEVLVLDLARRLDALERGQPAPPRVEHVERASRAEPASREVDAHWYLERYVASFLTDAAGDEFYRLAVKAYVAELLDEVAAIVGSSRRPEELRLRLAEMLGHPRFRSNARVLDALFAALMDRSATRLAQFALAALAELGDLGIAERLERVVWSLDDEKLRHSALRAIVNLYGPDGNHAIERLFANAPADADLAFLLSLLSTADDATALRVIQRASLLAQPVRLPAAEKVGEFRTPDALALIDAWLAYERDEEVRRALHAARAKASSTPGWHAMKACGPPDSNPQALDDQNAWATKGEDMGVQWIELTYAPPLRASRVRVFGVNLADCVSSVTAIDEGGKAHALWPGGDSAYLGQTFELDFAPTSFRIARLRVAIDTDRRPGWNEVDACELSGPDGSAWAAHAGASSTWGQ